MFWFKYGGGYTYSKVGLSVIIIFEWEGREGGD